MSFTDPISITISAVQKDLPRTSVSGDESTYTDASGLWQILASHETGKRTRHMVRINHSKITADPFIPAENVKVSMSNYIVFDVPPAGYTIAEQLAVWAGFRTWLVATSDLAVSKLLAGES